MPEEENHNVAGFRYRVIVEGYLQVIDPLKLHCKDPTVEQGEIPLQKDTIESLHIAVSDECVEPVHSAHIEGERDRAINGKRGNVWIHAQQVEQGFSIMKIVQDGETHLQNGTEHLRLAPLLG